MKKILKDKKGFTLAELLIVVAIIGVLVAVSIPIFTAQLKKARLATNQANARAAYAAAVAKRLDDKKTTAATYTYDIKTAVATETGTAGKTATAISEWKEDQTVGTVELGKDLANTWTVTFGENDTDGIKFGADK